MRKLAALSVFVLSGLIASAASAATYYINAATGNDTTGTGATGSPWKTINRALTVLLPGDIVEVAAGTYAERVVVSTIGLQASPIIFRNATGATPIIDGTTLTTAECNTITTQQPCAAMAGCTWNGTACTGWAHEAALVSIEGEYVTFQGFEIRNSKGGGVNSAGRNNSLLNLKVHDNAYGGLGGNGPAGTPPPAANLTVANCDIYQNVTSNKNKTIPDPAAAVGINAADGVKFLTNNVYNNYGPAIQLGDVKNTQVQGNRIYDNLGGALFLGSSSTTTINANFIYCTGAAAYTTSNGSRSAGILTEDTTTSGTGNVITNNIVTSCGSGFAWEPAATAGGGLKQGVVSNNTFVNNIYTIGGTPPGNVGIAITIGLAPAGNPHTGNDFSNNIVIQTNQELVDVGTTITGWTFSNNNWLGGTVGAPVASAATDVVANCNLTNAGGILATDYTIPANSACRNKGKTVAKVTTDYFGTARPEGAAYDVGAHEVGGTVPTPDAGPPKPDQSVKTDAKLPDAKVADKGTVDGPKKDVGTGDKGVAKDTGTKKDGTAVADKGTTTGDKGTTTGDKGTTRDSGVKKDSGTGDPAKSGCCAVATGAEDLPGPLALSLLLVALWRLSRRRRQ